LQQVRQLRPTGRQGQARLALTALKQVGEGAASGFMPQKNVRNSYLGTKSPETTGKMSGRFVRRAQLVDATHALKRSAGVSYPTALSGH